MYKFDDIIYKNLKYIKKNKKHGILFKIEKDDNVAGLINWYRENSHERIKLLQKLVGGGYFEEYSCYIEGLKYNIYCNEDGRGLFEKNIILSHILGYNLYGDCLLVYNSSCDTCGKSLAEKKCMKCKKMRYCGKECQKEDWECHKEYCK
jgi:hypothetical protein